MYPQRIHDKVKLYTVLALITLEAFITAFEITPASTDDREGLRDLVMALKRSNSKTDWPRPVRQLIFRLRRRVETVFSQLSEQLNAERVHAKSFQGLCTRLVNKVLAYNLCLALNYMLGENCEIGKIKQLIF